LTESADGSQIAREVAEAHALLETYRAQIEQCEKLKVELDLIHDAINRTKREIATLHGKSFDGGKWPRSMANSAPSSAAPNRPPSRFSKPSRRSTRRPPRCPRTSRRPAEAAQRGNPGTRRLDLRGLQLPGPHRPAHQQGDDHDEVHRKAHQRHDGYLGRRRRHQGARAPIVDTREGDAKLLNGPKLDGDDGHASQDDIDALFD
jgi:chemotaxis protein CheZ